MNIQILLRPSCHLALATSLVMLAGCSLTGLDASSKFACKAPAGVACESMSGVYANLQAGNLPAQQTSRTATASATTTKTPAPGAETLSRPLFSGTPIRSAPRELRLWFAPWQDDDGDLYDQAYAYLVIDNGRWLIAHNQRRIRDLYRPAPIVRSPDGGDASDTEGRAPGAKPSPAWTAPVPSPSASGLTTGSTPAANDTSAATDSQVRQPAMNAEALRQIASGVRMPDGAQIGSRAGARVAFATTVGE